MAGSFYASSKSSLLGQIEDAFTHKFGPGVKPVVSEGGERSISALVCPHAGYMYSAPVAAIAYYRLSLERPPSTIVIIGPNHTGLGSGVSIMVDGSWETPLGNVTLDEDLGQKIMANSNIIDVEEQAHRYEHSIEVQLPFIQYLFGDRCKIVPICMMMQDLETSREVGEAVAKAIRGHDAMVIASSDMTHYEPHDVVTSKDKKAVDAILSWDEPLLQRLVESEGVTMCGYGPVTSVMRISKLAGSQRVELLSHRTSGEMTGDIRSVVGYASLLFTR